MKSKMLSVEKLASPTTEHASQVALMQKIATSVKDGENYHLLRLIFAIPNGGERDRAVAGRLKAEGVKSGVSDLFLPVPVWSIDGFKCGLFLELKRPDSIGKSAGKPSEQQIAFLQEMHKRGYSVTVRWGWEDAWDALTQYIRGEPVAPNFDLEYVVDTSIWKIEQPGE